MSDDTEVGVKITADASGMTAGAAEANSAVGTLQTEVAELATEMKTLTEATEQEVISMKEMAASVKEGADAILEAKEAISHFGEAIMAAFAVEAIVEWSEKTAEAGEHAEQLGARLGMSTTEVERWQSVATLSGRDVDQFASAMTRLTNTAVKAEAGAKGPAAAFRDLGISAKEATNPQQLMLDVADRFAKMHEAGETGREIANAMALMGRSGAEMIPILQKGSDGIKEMMDQGQLAGIVLDAFGNEKIASTSEAINKFKLDMEGLSKQAFVQLIPEISGAAHAMADFANAIEHAIQPGSTFRETADLATKAVIALGAATGATLAANFVMGSAALATFTGEMALQTSLAALEGVTLTGFGAAFAALSISIQGATVATLEFPPPCSPIPCLGSLWLWRPLSRVTRRWPQKRKTPRPPRRT